MCKINKNTAVTISFLLYCYLSFKGPYRQTLLPSKRAKFTCVLHDVHPLIQEN